jgi:hypothetical protein
MALLNFKFLFLIFFSVLAQDNEPVISWNPSNKITWSDFKGKPIANSDAVATTASGITFGFSITQKNNNDVVAFTTEVHAHFYPKQSWYKVERADAHILDHERLHFDITELYARKFRYRISMLTISNSIKRQLKKMHNDINSELAEMQDKYDSETDFSRNFDSQALWKAYIDAELKKYDKYQYVN